MMHDYRSAESMSIEGLIGLQRRLSASKNPFDRVIGTLCVAGLLKERFAVLTDAAVGQLMLDYVWNELNLLEPESVIVEIASERLLHSSPVLVKNEKENLHR
jgi:hypothetical protein